jgi:hypothetical protein
MMRPKEKRLEDLKYLLHLREQPCIVSGHYATDTLAVDPSHVGCRGRGIKSDDCLALPLRHDLHAKLHQHGEATFYRENLPDYVIMLCVKAYCRELYEAWKAGK